MKKAFKNDSVTLSPKFFVERQSKRKTKERKVVNNCTYLIIFAYEMNPYLYKYFNKNMDR